MSGLTHAGLELERRLYKKNSTKIARPFWAASILNGLKKCIFLFVCICGCLTVYVHSLCV